MGGRVVNNGVLMQEEAILRLLGICKITFRLMNFMQSVLLLSGQTLYIYIYSFSTTSNIIENCL